MPGVALALVHGDTTCVAPGVHTGDWGTRREGAPHRAHPVLVARDAMAVLRSFGHFPA